MLDWMPFLTRWSQQLMHTDLAPRVQLPLESSDWLGFSPATATDIAELEQRLGVILPPSYKAFLLTTNGWRRTTFFIDRIRPAIEVDWFRVENEQWADVYAESGSDLADVDYYDYSKGAAPDHRAAHMPHLLQVSDVDDGVYLLNPQAVTPDGEWEAWFFANWVPGAERYPSFAHLMLAQYRTFADLEKVQVSSHDLPTLPIPSPSIRRVPARRTKPPAAIPPPVEDLIDPMTQPDAKARAKAVRTFFGKLKGRPQAKRRPDLVPRMVALYYASPHTAVRCACLAALTEWADDNPAPTPFLDALSDPNPEIVLQGIFALTYFPNPRALEPLCRFIESRADILVNENAMCHLGEMGDPRAVPTLVGVLLDTQNKVEQSFGSAAIALARCGPPGFDALVTAVDHPDPRVRFAVAVGLDTSGDPRAALYLDRMETDPDEKVRKRAKIRMGNPLK